MSPPSSTIVKDIHYHVDSTDHIFFIKDQSQFIIERDVFRAQGIDILKIKTKADYHRQWKKLKHAIQEAMCIRALNREADTLDTQ